MFLANLPVIKKFVKKKRRRFERPRFRVLASEEKTETASERELRTTSDRDPISQVDKTLFSEIVSEYVISDQYKQFEESSSTEEYCDAQDDKAFDEISVVSKSMKNEIKVSLSVNGRFINVSVMSNKGNKSVEISKNDFEKSGLDLTFSSSGDESPSLTAHSCGTMVYGGATAHWQSGDCQGLLTRINAEAQTAVILGTDEITDTEDASVMSYRKERRLGTVQEEAVEESVLSLPNESFLMSEGTDDNQQSFDSAPLIKSEAISSCDEEDDLESESRVFSKLKSRSTISSIPLDTYSALEKKSNPDVSIDLSTQNDNQTKEVSSAVPSIPLVKSKSDSLVLPSGGRYKQKRDHGTVHRKESPAYPEIFSLMYSKAEEDDWEYPSNRPSVPYCSSNEWFNEKSYRQEYGMEKTESEITDQLYRPESHYNEEALERPMTSAADAVKSMHQALKPISDQINDIRTKMIGMNIQPRSSSHHKFGHRVISNRPSQESNYSTHSAGINQWLLTDPQEFSSSLTNSEGSLKGYEYLINDFHLAEMKQKHRRLEKLVIFPGDLHDSDFNYNMDDISLARSSIVTEPDDIFNKSYRGPRKKREM